MSVATLTASEYGETERWDKFFDSGKTLRDVEYDLSWFVMFSYLMKDARFDKINEKLKALVQKDKNIKIFPFPSYVFKAFQLTKASEVKVVIIGQDPYFNCEYHDGKYIPQAMGFSFSVPHGVGIPSSLNNMYENMKKNKQIKKIPESGNLWFWAVQGCLMLNAALTVEDKTKEAHLKIWEWFTNYVIEYISTNMDNIVFVLWGAYAYEKIKLIDESRHHVIVSSHPSGLSANRPFRTYPSFMDQDSFGKINKQLEKYGKKKILWE